jgi:hypothetical protein
MVIRRIEPVPAAKVMGTLYALLGFIIGVCVALVSLAGGLASARLGGFGLGFGIGAIIVAPILYGVIGFLITLLGAALYNWAAGRVGGIQIQTE